MTSPIQVADLQVEKVREPLGIDTAHPAFGWSFDIASQARGLRQSGYRILVASRPELLETGEADMWDSGETVSDRHAAIVYGGSELLAGRPYYWKVRIWDAGGDWSKWSPVATWGMGLLRAECWQASWIGVTEATLRAWTKEDHPDGAGPMPLLRHDYEVDGEVRRAVVYICGLGQFELTINGKQASENVLEPGWTDYDKTCLYGVYDVTRLVRVGRNAIGVMLGNGFYNVSGTRYTKFKGSYGLPKAIVQLEIELADGRMLRICSGEDWQIAPGPIVFSCVYGGEDYDARRELAGWDLPLDRQANAWEPCEIVEAPKGTLRSYPFPPNKVMRIYEAVDKRNVAPGIALYDFGANFSGRPRVRLKGKRGTVLKLVPGEVLDDEGRVSQEWTGSPISFSYTLKGEGEEEWQPRFSYHGFRYVQAEWLVGPDAEDGAPEAELLEIRGEMIYPDLPDAGSFECSRSDWNGIHRLILQAVLSNVKSVLTDCPHREKLSWLEQYHLMGPSICYNYDLSALLAKSFEDMREAQLENGLIPDIAPEYTVFDGGFRDSPEWGSAYILAPWYYYRWYGEDERILSRHYDAMKRYMDYLASTAPDGIVRHGLGDWGNIWQNLGDGTPDHTPMGVTATATYYCDCLVMEAIALILGHPEDAKAFGRQAAAVRAAFEREWYDGELGTYASGSQTSLAAPLAFGLAAGVREEQALDRLLEELKERDYAITSGEVGHRYLLKALTRLERPDIVQRMLVQSKQPYYAYQVTHGATSLTEFWDGPTMGASQNHFMMGHIEEWFYAVLAGIRIDYDGFGDGGVEVKPYLAPGVDWARASHTLPQGKLSVAWSRDEHGDVELVVVVPVSAEVLISIPASDASLVTEGGIPLDAATGLVRTGETAGYVQVRAGSGSYRFRSAMI